MTTYLNRSTATLAWIVSMSIAWALFVPRGVSVTTFILLGIAGLLVLWVGGALLNDSQPPRSVGQILSELEAGSTAGPTRRT
jgi:multisubunit Na+/H+ antiporter MnhB subunit